ncbi:MAG: hypothetical protein L6300_15910 [Syntrophaceae bacterium]|nr:hypothetical protein [Syntrophaceae bacterium]
MNDIQTADTIAAAFIARWELSGGKELANYQSFLIELCSLLDVAPPDPTTTNDQRNAYVFERSVPYLHSDVSSGTGRIDLYKRGCFVLETKQGVDRHAAADPYLKTPKLTRKGHAVRGTGGWDTAMYRAKEQAEGYARSLSADEGRPPFLVVVDVGHCIELYSEFSCTGGIYRPFPDSISYRIPLRKLADADIRERLRHIWTDPLSLDPSRHHARVTRELAIKLADLAKSLEFSGHEPDRIGEFLMRCLFTFFAEDIGLIPEKSFSAMIEGLRGNLEMFPEMVTDVWEAMRDGGKSIALKRQLLHFNGGLFDKADALPVNEAQLELLIEAGKADWRYVEPAIFGTLLERALNPRDRHKLGAHYTPREYVERLVLPTIIEPLTAQWKAVKAKAIAHLQKGQTEAAKKLLKAFHHQLCTVRILDPACGSGNFLYVTFEHLKRLEGEVLTFLDDLGEHARLELEGVTVNPHQLLGIEVNPQAAVITDMVLWIGYLQWHFRTHGNVMPPTPVIRKFHNVECRDAVLAWDRTEPLLDGNGEPITRWDGVTFKKHPVTGEDVPDETARIPLLRYINPHPASWPEADYVVGNPPFIGNWRMRQALGDGYAEALRRTWPDVSESADYVMYWWHMAGQLAREEKIKRFGFITTNSLPMINNRKVLQHHLGATPPLSVIFAIPDHPWVDSADGAAVRIAMTVGRRGNHEGRLCRVLTEETGSSEGMKVQLSEQTGKIFADLTIGADVAGAEPLRASEELANRGMQLFGAGFIVTPDEARNLGLGRIKGLEKHIRPYRNGRDIAQSPRGSLVIDLFGLALEEVKSCFPEVYQWLLERVKPERDQNNRASYRNNWWIFGEPRKVMRRTLEGLSRYIATVETAKHRVFVFLDKEILPDNKLVNIASADAFHLGVLSCRVHVVWALATGGRLGVGNDPVYNKTRCFEPFPFPACDETQTALIRERAELLDAHRKRQQALHPDLGLTDMYNVLEKLRSGDALTTKERTIHDQGLVAVLKQLHEDLDTAVFAAYGWPAALTDQEILEHLAALNRERAKEEKEGVIRWLRPEFQNPYGTATTVQAEMTLVREDTPFWGRAPLPKDHTAQLQAVRAALSALKGRATADEVAKCFLKARPAKVSALLEDLVKLGLARKDGDRYIA